MNSSLLFIFFKVWFQNRRSKERRMKQLNAMGNRRHYYRNSSAVANRIQTTQQAQPPQQQPNQPQQQQQIAPQMNLQHNQNLVNRDQYDMSVGIDMMGNGSGSMPGMSQGMNQGYMHQGKVPYNMYLF